MSKRLHIKLNAQELEAVTKFARDVGVPTERLLKLCLFHSMKLAYERGNAEVENYARAAANAQGVADREIPMASDSNVLASPADTNTHPG